MSEEDRDVRRSLIYLQAAKAGVDAVRAVQMAEDFDTAMQTLITSAGTSIEEMDALKASILALGPTNGYTMSVTEDDPEPSAQGD